MKRYTCQAKGENLEDFLEQMRQFLMENSASKKSISQMSIVADEIFANVCSYAYPEDEGNIDIDYGLDENEDFILIFTDRGIPFDPLKHEDPDTGLPIEERDIGGLGILMVKNMVDEISYKRENDCNCLMMRKVIK